MKIIMSLFVIFIMVGWANPSKKIMSLMHAPMMQQPMSFTSNPDRDFLTNMIPHHKGAILSSEEYLKTGQDSRVIALARTIIADQKREITEFKQIIQDMKDDINYEGLDTQKLKDKNISQMKTMMKSMSTVKLTGNIDKDFILGMIPHHIGAVEASKSILTISKNPQIRKIAQNIIDAQESEIAQMKKILASIK